MLDINEKYEKRQRMLFGRRSSSFILQMKKERDDSSASVDLSSTESLSDNVIPEGLERPPTPPDYYKKREKKNFMDQFIIDCDNSYKGYFDAFILAIVGYSCIMSLYNSAFTASSNKIV